MMNKENFIKEYNEYGKKVNSDKHKILTDKELDTSHYNELLDKLGNKYLVPVNIRNALSSWKKFNEMRGIDAAKQFNKTARKYNSKHKDITTDEFYNKKPEDIESYIYKIMSAHALSYLTKQGETK